MLPAFNAGFPTSEFTNFRGSSEFHGVDLIYKVKRDA